MKKQLAALVIIASLLFVIGCSSAPHATPTKQSSVTEQTHTQPAPQPVPGEEPVDIADLDTLNDDLDMSELDSLDDDLNFKI